MDCMNSFVCWHHPRHGGRTLHRQLSRPKSNHKRNLCRESIPSAESSRRKHQLRSPSQLHRHQRTLFHSCPRYHCGNSAPPFTGGSRSHDQLYPLGPCENALTFHLSVSSGPFQRSRTASNRIGDCSKTIFSSACCDCASLISSGRI